MKKKRTIPTSSPVTAATVEAIAGPSGKSLEERVNEIKRRLTLIQSATLPFMYTAFDPSDLASGEPDDLIHAIRVLSEECLALLEPLTDAPGDVACWVPEKDGAR